LVGCIRSINASEEADFLKYSLIRLDYFLKDGIQDVLKPAGALKNVSRAPCFLVLSVQMLGTVK